MGRGEFAEVLHVRSYQDGRDYAVKRAHQAFQGLRDALHKLDEVELWSSIDPNPWCVKFYQAWVQEGYLFIQLELCEFGRTDADLKYDKELIYHIAVDVAKGLSKIHERQIVHLDIKPANILMASKTSFKIGDFGMAARTPVPKGADHEGDRAYLAPEVLSSLPVGPAADVFSLGLMLLEIFADIDLPENGPIWQNLRHGDLRDIETPNDPDMLNFISGMLMEDPSMRITPEGILAFPPLLSFLAQHSAKQGAPRRG
eukprot:jgi/Hompol1/6534/HPOL_000187-RA